MNFVDPVFRGLGISIDKDAVDAFKDRSKNVFAALPLRESTSAGRTAPTRRELSERCSPSAIGIAASGQGSGTAGKDAKTNASSSSVQVRQDIKRSGHRQQRSRRTNRRGRQKASSFPPKERPGYTCYSMSDVDVSDAAISTAASNFLRELVNQKKKKKSASEPESENLTAKFGSRRKKKKLNVKFVGSQEEHRCAVGISSIKLNLGWQSPDLEDQDTEQLSGKSLDSHNAQIADVVSDPLLTKHDTVPSQVSAQTRFRSRRRVKKSLRRGSKEISKRPDSTSLPNSS